MIASEIGAALKARLAALTFSPAIPISWPNRDFAPGGTRYLAAQIEGIPNQRLTIGGAHRIAGTLLVSVVIPAGGGSGEADGIADAVAAHFPCDLRLSLSSATLRVISAPSVRTGYRDGAYWRVPVVISFEVLTS